MSADEKYEERQAILGLALSSLPKDEEAKVRAALAEKAEEEARDAAAKKARRTKARVQASEKAQTETTSRAERKQAREAISRAEVAITEGELKPEPPPPTLTQSLAFLTQHPTLGAGRTSHRVLHLDLMAKLADRRGAEGLKAVDVELKRWAKAAVDEADRVAGDSGPSSGRVQETVDALYAVANTQGVTEHHWTRFANAAKKPLKLTDTEIHRPLCTDHQEVLMPGGLPAVRTAVWMWSDQPAETFADWTDPRTWATSCGLFFRSVEPTGPSPKKSAQEFTAEFKETVNVDGRNDLSTKLVFSRSIVDEPRSYALGFRLPDPPLPKTAPILVDCGQITVREDPHAPPEMRTSLLAEKYIRFRDPAYATWPTVACDLFWTEFAIIMAEGC